MDEIIREYGKTIIGVICIVLLLGIIVALVFNDSGTFKEIVSNFMTSICGN